MEAPKRRPCLAAPTDMAPKSLPKPAAPIIEAAREPIAEQPRA